VPGGGEHGGRRLGIQPAGPGLGPQLVGGLVSSGCRPVRPRLGPRLVEVGRGEQPRTSA